MIRFLLLLLLNCPLFMQAQTNFFNPFKIAEDIFKQDESNYQAPIIALEAMSIDSLDRSSKSMYTQVLSTYQSFAGDYRTSLATSDKRKKKSLDAIPKTTIDSAFLNNYKFVNAKKYILQRAEKEQVVMINEAHHVALHRAFVYDLLADFKALGYEYLTLEALSKDSFIYENKQPIIESGFYTIEPAFGELLRHALDLGFKLVAHESREKCDRTKKRKERYYCSNFRDSIQAVNVRHILEKEPTAKILAYVGYSHIKETNSNGSKRLAEWLKQMTGIDPFTIDQTAMYGRSSALYEGEIYRSFLSLNFRMPQIAIQEKTDSLWSYRKGVDVSIFQPAMTYVSNRPAFYLLNGKKKAVALKRKYRVEEGNYIQAFYAHEKGNRIPADQFFVKKGSEQLFLFPAKYDIIVRDRKGEIKKQFKLKVKDRSTG